MGNFVSIKTSTPTPTFLLFPEICKTSIYPEHAPFELTCKKLQQWIVTLDFTSSLQQHLSKQNSPQVTMGVPESLLENLYLVSAPYGAVIKVFHADWTFHSTRTFSILFSFLQHIYYKILFVSCVTFHVGLCDNEKQAHIPLHYLVCPANLQNTYLANSCAIWTFSLWTHRK